jgi:very-short-patch-repair endonuclease
LLDHVRDSLAADPPRHCALARAARVLATLSDELRGSDWYTETWLEEALNQDLQRLDAACNRWRGLYRSAMAQRDLQNRIIGDASRKAADKNRARLLRQEAESQLDLLTEASNLAQADFYSYRNFASEGFLPGYNFPRLPLSAYIPGRRARQTRDEFVSRPRFLAISEFGPRSILYHEGSRYQINRVILPVEESDRLPTEQIKLCPECGYLHPVPDGVGPDCCDRCGFALGPAVPSLFRLQNVSTKRREKINCDEEERLRLGYQIQTAARFAEQGGRPSYRTAIVKHDGAELATLAYGQAATLWRINLGENRRKVKERFGFVLDVERGYWAKSEQVPDEGDEPDPLIPRTALVIPYVEDHRNALLLEFHQRYDVGVVASLQAALKNAIQVRYQLEDGELAIEPLPTRDKRRLILIYESAEGGAGVLRRLVEDAHALGGVAREALRICHYDPETGADLRRAPRAREDCEAACYDCLMSYTNQPDHSLLDRRAILPILRELTEAHVASAPVAAPRSDHLERLIRLAASDLERDWLRFLETRDRRLPTGAQELIARAETRPDFVYADQHTVIYIDGPVHEYPERHRRDVELSERLEDLGFTVIRFGRPDDWAATIDCYPNIFGAGRGA